MDLYVILRRSGWQSPAELQDAAERSTQVGNDEMADEVRWIRSYVLNEDEGSVGTVCIYEAVGPAGGPPGRRDHPGRGRRDSARRSVTRTGHS